MTGHGGTGSCPIGAASGRSSAAPGAGSGSSETTCSIKDNLVKTFTFDVLFYLFWSVFAFDLLYSNCKYDL